MNRFKTAVLAGAAVMLVSGAAPSVSASSKPTIVKPCIGCHDAEEQVVRGRLTNLSNKAKTLQIEVGDAVWLFSFGDETGFKNAEGIGSLKKNGETAVTFEKRDGKLFAKRIAIKPKFEVPAEQLVDTGYVSGLIEKSPEEGGYVLVDCRPGPKYHEGHIRNALSMPFPAFDKMKDKVLPADKGKLVVFYCGGDT